MSGLERFPVKIILDPDCPPGTAYGILADAAFELRIHPSDESRSSFALELVLGRLRDGKFIPLK